MPPTPDLDVAEPTTVREDFTRTAIRLPSARRLSFTTLSVPHTLERGGPRRLGELTASEQVTQSAVTQIVTGLARDGLVERRPGPTDGRAVVVHLTEAGAAVVRDRRAQRTCCTRARSPTACPAHPPGRWPGCWSAGRPGATAAARPSSAATTR